MFTCVVQAEDGIRDLVRSRGLGDVYKRQIQKSVDLALNKEAKEKNVQNFEEEFLTVDEACKPVSYTHLTLPTSDLV